jgi:RimJ/RimL family protein N-acetyltransferase
MRHSISLECVRYRLRPVTLDDAPFIVELRKDPILSRYVHEISTRVEDQISWLEKYFERPDDYYFIVEDADSREPHGTIGIYNFDSRRSASWGRWILNHGSMAALESVWLICEVGFSRLTLQHLKSQTLTENLPVISFHETFGATRGATLSDYFRIRGEHRTAVEHCIRTSDWTSLRERHYGTISRLAHRA